jgi:hypothetical protein
MISPAFLKIYMKITLKTFPSIILVFFFFLTCPYKRGGKIQTNDLHFMRCDSHPIKLPIKNKKKIKKRKKKLFIILVDEIARDKKGNGRIALEKGLCKREHDENSRRCYAAG